MCVYEIKISTKKEKNDYFPLLIFTNYLCKTHTSAYSRRFGIYHHKRFLASMATLTLLHL